MIANLNVSSPDLVKQLLSLIRVDGLTPGDRLPSIRQLSTRFAVRPHTVRDALLQVQSMGHVVVRPRSRAVVQSLQPSLNDSEFQDSVEATLGRNDHHLFHLLEARQTLEFELVCLAARRRRLEDLLPVRDALNAMNSVHEPDRPHEYFGLDIRFHLAIARLAGNSVLTSMLKPLLTALCPFLTYKTGDAVREDQTRRSHAEIYRALVLGDPELARQQMQEHLQLAYDKLLGEVQLVPDHRRTDVNRPKDTVARHSLPADDEMNLADCSSS